MKRVYIKDLNAIALFGGKADSHYWDTHWKTENLRKFITSCKNSNFIMKPLRKYLPNERGIILEGGCGRAQNVYCMKYHGYNAIGVDFAENTVNLVNEAVPELDVRRCDVRSLPFKDQEVAGYWSIGVIEHCWEGYRKILDEMARVIRRNNGFLFLSFPYMSPLRKLKAFLNMYEKHYSENEIASFYQYCLDHRKVIRELEGRGFFLRQKKAFDGIKGFKDEVNLFKPLLQQIYDGKVCKSKVSRIILAFLNRILELFSSHCILLVVERSESVQR